MSHQRLEVSGGKHMRRQTRKLGEGVQVVVGTPGRVLDHLSRGTLDLSRLWCVVLDEADRMLDIGFRPAIERILRSCPKNRQTLLLSATLADGVRELATTYLYEPVHVDCSKKDLSVDTIEQRYITVGQEQKFETLVSCCYETTTTDHYLLPHQTGNGQTAPAIGKSTASHSRTCFLSFGDDSRQHESNATRRCV